MQLLLLYYWCCKFLAFKLVFISPVIVNIYMKYFEELALGFALPIPIPWWKRYVDNVISKVKKEQLDTFFNI